MKAPPSMILPFAAVLLVTSLPVIAERSLDDVISDKIQAAEQRIDERVAAAQKAASDAREKAGNRDCQSTQKRVIKGDAKNVTQVQTGNCNSQSLVIGGSSK